jgi:hypothetical protein
MSHNLFNLWSIDILSLECRTLINFHRLLLSNQVVVYLHLVYSYAILILRLSHGINFPLLHTGSKKLLSQVIL